MPVLVVTQLFDERLLVTLSGLFCKAAFAVELALIAFLAVGLAITAAIAV